MFQYHIECSLSINYLKLIFNIIIFSIVSRNFIQNMIFYNIQLSNLIIKFIKIIIIR